MRVNASPLKRKRAVNRDDVKVLRRGNDYMMSIVQTAHAHVQKMRGGGVCLSVLHCVLRPTA